MISPRLVTPPTTFPVSFELAKKNLRVDHDDDDDLIQQVMMPSALAYIEDKVRFALMPQTWEVAVDAFPSAEIYLRPGPVASVTSVVFIDAEGADQTVDASEYEFDGYGPAGWVVPTASWPATMATVNAVRVRWIAGTGCPPGLVPAFLLMLSHLYDNRNAVTAAASKEVPLGVTSMIENHRAFLTLA